MKTKNIIASPSGIGRLTRIIADEGKLLFDGNDYVSVIDVFEDEIQGWAEIDDNGQIG